MSLSNISEKPTVKEVKDAIITLKGKCLDHTNEYKDLIQLYKAMTSNTKA